MNLKNKLDSIINERNWYEIENYSYNSAGVLLESLLGIKKNDLPIPDYDKYELKTKFSDSLFNITLFHAAPDSYLFEIKRLYETYGYVSASNDNKKVFMSSFSCTKITQLGLNIGAKLHIDWENQKIVLKLYNFETNTIDDKVAWSFEMLKERIELKLKKLCLVNVERKYINNKLYCKFTSYSLYEYKGFEYFLKGIKYGYINITFCVNVFKSGRKIGQMHDHGTSFNIDINNLNYIFAETK